MVNDDDARDLLSRLLHGIAPEIDLGAAPPDAHLQDDFDLDSMDFLSLITGLDDEIGLDVPDRDHPQLATIGGFVKYVVAHTT